MIQSAIDWVKGFTGLPDEGAEMVMMIVAIYALAALVQSVSKVASVKVKV